MKITVHPQKRIKEKKVKNTNTTLDKSKVAPNILMIKWIMSKETDRIKQDQDINYKIRMNRKNKSRGIRKSKCGWCGKSYVKTANKQKYCSEECRRNAIREQARIKSHRWYHRHKHELSEKQRWGLGSGVLGQHCHKDPIKEQKTITRELKRLGIYNKVRK